MKVQGFIGPAYTLDSVNVDAQRCVNLYPEIIESGTGKNQVGFLRSTPGLENIVEVGDGPIRLIHVDSIGRIFVVSGNRVYVITESSGTWTATEVKSTGIGSGNSVILASSSGPVKAASMSFGGDGTDSSTVFVDGSNNYLFKDDVSDTFGILGSVDVAEALFNITTDVKIYSQESVADLIANSQFQISATANALAHAGIDIDFTFDTATDNYAITIRTNNGGGGFPAMGLTTAELVTFINSGTVSGKTFTLNSGGLGAGVEFRDLPLTFAASGGDATSVVTEFGAGINVNFTAQTYSGASYGSVPTATDIGWSDGYFIVNEAGTNKFYVSDLQDFNIDTLSFASSEGNPDIVLALMINHRDLYVFNEKTTEVYSNTGNADFPYERVQGGFLEVGCLAKYSVAKIAGTIFWLGRSDEGAGVVYSIQGLSPKRISTHAIEQAIADYADPEDAVGYTYQQGGHSFYVLNFAEATWVYDLSTGLWHERAYTNAGTLERHRANNHAYYASLGVHIVGDYEDNRVYLLKEDVYDDDEDEITRLRSSPHISSDMNLVFCSKFQLDMETGVGLVSGQGSDPQVMLDWSNDGGHTWSDEAWTSAGGQVGGVGEYNTRVIWRRLGKFRDRVWRVKITDPVKVTLIDAHMDVQVGGS